MCVGAHMLMHTCTRARARTQTRAIVHIMTEKNDACQRAHCPDDIDGAHKGRGEVQRVGVEEKPRGPCRRRRIQQEDETDRSENLWVLDRLP